MNRTYLYVHFLSQVRKINSAEGSANTTNINDMQTVMVYDCSGKFATQAHKPCFSKQLTNSNIMQEEQLVSVSRQGAGIQGLQKQFE
jgi:hypothetical protein